MTSRLVLPALVVALLGLRVATILTSIESVSFFEELYRGTIAKELVEGLKAPLWMYQADHYQTGSLVVGVLAAPLFSVFGPTLLSLKAVPLLFSAALVVLLFVFLDRFFGRASAVIGAGLVILAPPWPTALSLLAIGFHTESVLFTVLILIGWYTFAFGQRRRGLGLSLFGLASGLGISFTYVTAATAAGCLASWPVLRPRCRRRWIAALVAGFVIGLLPWLLYNLIHDFAGLRFGVGVFADTRATTPGPELTRLGRKAAALLIAALPRSYGFERLASIPGQVLSYLYFVVVFVVISWDVVRKPEHLRKLLPILLSAAAFVIAFVLSGYDVPYGWIDSRFLAPLHLMLVLMVAAGVAGSHRRWAVVVLLVLGLAGQWMLLGRAVPSNLRQYRGYAYLQLGELWYLRLRPESATFPAMRAMLERLNDIDRRFTYWGAFDRQQSEWSDVVSVVRRIGAVPSPYRIYFAGVAGETAGRRAIMNARDLEVLTASMSLEEREHFLVGYIRAASETIPVGEYWRAFGERHPTLRGWLDFDLGWSIGRACGDATRGATCAESIEVARSLSADRQAQVYRGLGRWKGASWTRPDTLDETRVGPSVPSAFEREIGWGIGWAVRDRFREDRARTLDWLDRLQPADRAAAREGLRAYDTWYRIEDTR